MIKCVNCNNEFADELPMCPFCGEEVKKEETTHEIKKPNFLENKEELEKLAKQETAEEVKEEVKEEAKDKKKMNLPLLIGILLLVVTIGIAVYSAVSNL